MVEAIHLILGLLVIVKLKLVRLWMKNCKLFHLQKMSEAMLEQLFSSYFGGYVWLQQVDTYGVMNAASPQLVCYCNY